MPPMRQIGATYKRAPRNLPKVAEQRTLYDEAPAGEVRLPQRARMAKAVLQQPKPARRAKKAR